MLLIWVLSASFLGSFLILQRSSLPLIIQPQAFAITGSIAYAQCKFYNEDWTRFTSVIAAVGGVLGVAALEVGMVGLGERDGRWTTVWGVLSAILIVGGLVPQCQSSPSPLSTPRFNSARLMRVESRYRDLQVQSGHWNFPNLPHGRHFRWILLLSFIILCSSIRFPRFVILYVPSFFLLPCLLSFFALITGSLPLFFVSA